MLRILLTQNGYRTLCAYSGTEGLLVHSAEINLILLDLMLPGKSGEEIIKELKKKHPVPVIVISAIHEVDKKVDLFSLGANDYITKPFSMPVLIRKVAAEGSCVLVGRCADYILRDDPDCVHVFISARMEDRIWRALEYNKDLTEKDAEDTVRKADKSRASYYNYYTDKVWGAAESYDLCVNSSLYGLEETVDYILSFLKRP